MLKKINFNLRLALQIYFMRVLLSFITIEVLSLVYIAVNISIKIICSEVYFDSILFYIHDTPIDFIPICFYFVINLINFWIEIPPIFFVFCFILLVSTYRFFNANVYLILIYNCFLAYLVTSVFFILKMLVLTPGRVSITLALLCIFFWVSFQLLLALYKSCKSYLQVILLFGIPVLTCLIFFLQPDKYLFYGLNPSWNLFLFIVLIIFFISFKSNFIFYLCRTVCIIQLNWLTAIWQEAYIISDCLYTSKVVYIYRIWTQAEIIQWLKFKFPVFSDIQYQLLVSKSSNSLDQLQSLAVEEYNKHIQAVSNSAHITFIEKHKWLMLGIGIVALGLVFLIIILLNKSSSSHYIEYQHNVATSSVQLKLPEGHVNFYPVWSNNDLSLKKFTFFSKSKAMLGTIIQDKKVIPNFYIYDIFPGSKVTKMLHKEGWIFNWSSNDLLVRPGDLVIGNINSNCFSVCGRLPFNSPGSIKFYNLVESQPALSTPSYIIKFASYI